MGRYMYGQIYGYVSSKYLNCYVVSIGVCTKPTSLGLYIIKRFISIEKFNEAVSLLFIVRDHYHQGGRDKY